MPSPRRLFRLNQALHRRQTDIVVALDRVHDKHNISAVLRTADAVGISRVYWEADPRRVEESVNPEVSKGTERWVKLLPTKNLVGELQKLRKKGFGIAATHLSRTAVDFRSIDWTTPWVVVMGNEHAGCQDAIVEMADANILLPMAGLVQSLNISVATAVLLYEIQRQRELAGLYAQRKNRVEVRKLLKFWELLEEGYRVEDFLEPPSEHADLPALEGHGDGRLVNFSRVRRREERLKSSK